jgi:colanic acid biosynthesis glycosyl transferase WcaI
MLVVHSGNMGVKQGLEVILGAAEFSRNDDSIQYLLVGNGAARDGLEARARALRLENVRFFPLLGEKQYGELLATTDISLVTQQKCVADIVFPSKVITLMASGQAIIASVNLGSEVARVLKGAAAGLVVPPEDPAKLFAAIASLRGDSVLRRKMAHNAREFARQNWDRDAILARMESQLHALIADHRVKASQSRRTWSVFRSRRRRAAALADWK